jgi:flagellar biosynthesis GTPase FlhF
MKIQRFQGKDVQEALKLAQLALGPEAVVLQTRRVQVTGLKRLVSAPRVEVLAAVEVNTPPAVRPTSRGLSATGERGDGTIRQRTSTSTSNEHEHVPNSPRRVKAPLESPRLRERSVTEHPQAGWQNELATLRREMELLRVQLRAGEPESERAAPRRHNGRVAMSGRAGGAVGQSLRRVVIKTVQGERRGHRPGTDEVMRSGGDEVRVEPDGPSSRGPHLITSSPHHLICPEPPATRESEDMAHRLLTGLVTRTIEMRKGACTMVALVGPTGVGKTTTLAKLAAVATHVEQKRVALITVDTFRIGAVEQLETYARLLGTPLTVAYSASDLRAARARYADFDLVLLDTAGRSPSNGTQLEELALLLDAARPDEVHLILDTRGSHATLRSVLRAFRLLGPTHLLLSKLDEAPRLEDSLAASLEARLPLSYITTGQRVPEDLAPAETAQLAGWLNSR